MNSWELDGIIGLALVIGLVRGGVTGPREQLVNLASLAIAFLAAFKLMEPVGMWIAFRPPPSETDMLVVGYGISFVTLLSMLYAFYHIRRHRYVDERTMPVAERVMGSALGVVFATAFVSILLMVFEQVGWPGVQAQEGTLLYHPVAQWVHVMWNGLGSVLPLGTPAEHFHGATAAGWDALIAFGLAGARVGRRRRSTRPSPQT